MIKSSLTVCGFAILLFVGYARADILYVANGGNGTIEKYSTSTATDLGSFFTLTGDQFTTLAFDANTSPSDPSAGDLYASYTVPGMFSRVIKISPTGTLLSTISTSGTGGIAVDGSGNVYLAGFSSIEKYSPTGTDLGTFATTGVHGAKGLAFDSSGNLYVANFSSNNIEKYSSSGASLGVFASPGSPIDLAFDRSGHLWVSSGDSVIEYSSTGTQLTAPLGGAGTGGASGVAFDTTGQLYVAAPSSNDIEKLSSTGTDLGTFDHDTNTPNDLALTNDLGQPLFLPGGVVPEPTTWIAAAMAAGLLIVQVVRAAAFSKRRS